MKLFLAISASAMLIANVAYGQTTTRCSTVDGVFACRTASDAAPEASPIPIKPCSALEIFANGSQGCAARAAISKRNAQRQEIGSLVADGKCGEAVKLALRSGDLKFASETREFCAVDQAVQK